MTRPKRGGIIQDAAGFYIDTATRNLSFLKMWNTLKDLKVKNNKFFLRLYDPELSGVDPHNPRLTPEMQLRVVQECISNPWYYIRECVRIPVSGGMKSYDINRGNLALTWCMLQNLNVIMQLPRQNFKTISACVVYSWVFDFGTENCRIMFGNKEKPDAERNLKNLKDIRENLPYYMKFADKKDVNNIGSISSAKNNNWIVTMASANDELTADKLGRGSTLPMWWGDEWAFVKYNEIIYGAAAPAQNQAMIESRRNDKPYGKLFTTTPNQLEDPAGKFCHDMMNMACQFDEAMYDWSEEQIRDYIRKNSDNNFIHIRFSWKELGRDQAWFEEVCRDLQNNQLKIRREIMLEWTYSSDVSPFTEDQIERLARYVVEEPFGKIYLQRIFPLTILENPGNWELPYIVAVDVASGLARDFSAIQIIHPVTLRSVATFKNNKIDTNELYRLICEVISYFPNCVVVVERNSMGKGVLDNLMHSAFEKFLYYEYRRQEAEKKIKSKTINTTKGTLVKVYGINTSVLERDRMINEVLYTIVQDTPDHIACPDVFQNIKNLERKKGNKIEHRSGESDDSLFAYLIGRYMLAYGKNLSKFMRWPAGDEPATVKARAKATENINKIIQASARPKEASDLWMAAVREQEKEEEAKSVTTKLGSQIRAVLDMNRHQSRREPNDRR
jgi:hypothetical protein